MISLADIEDARTRVAGVVRSTPVDRSDSLSKLCGRPVTIKPEHLQRTGSFKIRGAYNLISRLTETEEVVAASAGNHAQGVALAAQLTGHRSTIFMPANAPLPKLAATRGYGAVVIQDGEAVDDCMAAAMRYAEKTGAVYVPPFDDPLVIAGQGTVGLELAEECADAEVVVVPIGGGGLAAGVATALAHTRRSIRVIGVEPEGAACMAASLHAGQVVGLAELTTMADGVAVRSVSDLTLEHVKAYVDEVVTVSEEEISRAVLLMVERCKAVVEPAGAVAVAALLGGKVAGTGEAVAVVSGGNVDPLLLIRLIEHGLSAAGRYLNLRIVVDDRPGALAALTAEVAELGLNVVQVEHHRAGTRLGLDEVEVFLTLETRDPDHREEVVTLLASKGYRVTLTG
ncbi:MAG: threonine ammonia-lyase [Actinobacteria bacterium]|nr:threonine ammonia-lyase [Actinomycetota bacterium]